MKKNNLDKNELKNLKQRKRNKKRKKKLLFYLYNFNSV